MSWLTDCPKKYSNANNNNEIMWTLQKKQRHNICYMRIKKQFIALNYYSFILLKNSFVSKFFFMYSRMLKKKLVTCFIVCDHKALLVAQLIICMMRWYLNVNLIPAHTLFVNNWRVVLLYRAANYHPRLSMKHFVWCWQAKDGGLSPSPQPKPTFVSVPSIPLRG